MVVNKTAVLGAAGLAVGLAFISACSGSTSAPSGTITVYSGQHQQTTEELIAGFEKQTGINVAVRYDDENTFVDQIQAEGSNSPADVIFTENTPVLEELQEHNLLSGLPPSVLASTPPEYESPQGDWVGVSARVSVIVYNPSKISASQLPTRVSELADPRYKGELAFAPSETDFQPIVTAYFLKNGRAATEAWLKGIEANSAGHVYPDNETITADVNSGAVDFGVINQYYWYRLQAEQGSAAMHSKLAYFAPHDPGYVIDVSGAAVLASSHHRSDADRFVAYLTSRAGQEIIAHSQSFEYPLDDGIAPVAPETPFSQLQPDPLTLTQLGDGSTAVKLLQQAGVL